MYDENKNIQLPSEKDINEAVTKEFLGRIIVNGYTYLHSDSLRTHTIFNYFGEVCRFDEENNMRFKPQNREEAYELFNIRKECREYVTAYMTAKASGAERNQDYYVLLNLNGYVLAARQAPEDKSYSFVTWQQSPDHADYEVGHYFTDFAEAKEDFARRAGLINENKFFTETELTVIRSNLSDFLSVDNGAYLDYDREKAIRGVIEKIDEVIAPEVEEQREDEEMDADYEED